MRLRRQKDEAFEGFACARTIEIGNLADRESDTMSGLDTIAIPAGVTRIRDVRLSVRGDGWPYEVRHADGIAAHWQRRRAENPGFFNGRILVLRSGRVVDGVLDGGLATIDFAAFLHWREHGYQDATARDAFGSALILSRDGALMLARQSAGNLNEGLVYPPGGFIDPRDVAEDGTIDLAASIRREIAEETGLDVDDLTHEPGYLISTDGLQVAIGAVFRSGLDADMLRKAMLRGSAADPEGELIDVVAIRSTADADRHPLPRWTAALVAALLPA